MSRWEIYFHYSTHSFVLLFMQYAQAYLGVTRPGGVQSINDLGTALEVENRAYAPEQSAKH